MGLILPRNPFAYPGGQAKARYNPAHPAAGPKVRYAGVAAGANLINLLTGGKATVSGSSITSSVTPQGPAIVNASGAAGYLSTTGINDALTGLTFAAIYTPTSVSGSQVIFTNNGSAQNTNTCFFWANTSTPQVSFGSGSATSSVTLTVNTPYFLAATAVSTSLEYFIVVNLLTGKSVLTTNTSTISFGTATNSLYYIGGNNFSQAMAGDLAAVMYSAAGISVDALLQWAQAPWDFWYPPSTEQLIFSSLGTPPPLYGTANGHASVSGVPGVSGLANGQASVIGQPPVWGTANGQASASGGYGTIRNAAGTANGQASVIAISSPAYAAGTANGQASVIGSVLYTGSLAENMFASTLFGTQYTYPRAISQNFTVHQSDAEAWKWGRTITQALTLHQSDTELMHYHETNSDTIKITQALIRALPVTLSQNMTVHQAQTLVVMLQMLQKFGLVPQHIPEIHYHLLLSQALTGHDSLSLARFLGLTQNMSVHPAHVPQYTTNPVLTQNITIHPSVVNTLVLQFTQAINVHPAHIPQMLYKGDALIETIYITGFQLQPNGTTTTWAINTRTNAITEYQNYAFNSFAQAGLKYIAASSQGIFELDGDNDNGYKILSDIISGYMQLNQTKMSGLKGVYIAIRGTGQYVLKLLAGDGREYIYDVKPQPGLMNQKINVGKGLRSRYIAFELISSGPDFDLDSLEFVPMLSDRRV